MDAAQEYRNDPPRTTAPSVRPSPFARLAARLLCSRLDRMLAVGATGAPGSALAAHAERIVAIAHREAIARSLRQAVRDSLADGPANPSFRLPAHRVNLAAAEAVVDAVTLRLHSPAPVAARGMARLRRVLCDGAGPLYENGRGDLAGRLGAALAAL